MRKWPLLPINSSGPIHSHLVIDPLASLDLRRHGAVRLPRQITLHARGRTGPNGRPQVARVAQGLHRLEPKRDIVEHAHLEMLVEVRSKLGIRNAQLARRFEKPATPDHAAVGVANAGRQAEHRLCRAGQIIPNLTGERGHHRKTEWHIANTGGWQARLNPIGDDHIHLRHHERHIDERRHQKPVQPGANVEVECDDERCVDQPQHHYDLDHAGVTASTSPGGNRVQRLKNIDAASIGENLYHRHRRTLPRSFRARTQHGSNRAKPTAKA